MSNVSLLSKFQIATAFKNIDASQSLGEGITAGGFPSIRYRGKVWSLQYNGTAYGFRRVDDNTPQTYIDVVIISTNPFQSKVYFDNTEGWNEDSAGAPICASLRTDVPDPGVPVPQSKSCGICKHNEWITKPSGGRGMECQSHKRVAVLLMPAQTTKMLGQPLIEPVYLKIPPGSLGSFKAFGDELANQGVPPISVVTRIAFSQDPKKLFQMTFEVVQALNNDEAKVVLPMREASQTRQILGTAPQIREIASPKPKPAERIETGIMSAFSAAAPPADQDQVAPPAKRGGRPAGSQNKSKPVQIEATANPVTPEVQEQEPPERIVTKNGGPKAMEPEEMEAAPGTPWEESDTDLDDTVNQLLGEKMGSMFK